MTDFKITSVAREDLEGIGYDTSAVDDATMEHLASKMADAYCDNGFWIDLPILADHLGIPNMKTKQLQCPECGDDGVLQMDYITHAEVVIDSEGDIIINDDGMVEPPTPDDLDRDSLYCVVCGENYRLECTGEGEEERVYHLEKRMIIKLEK
jgi:hypothetical protein